jgi:hypothetical protein
VAVSDLATTRAATVRGECAVPDLGEAIREFLAGAEAAGEMTREHLRETRSALAHVVASELAVKDVAAVTATDVRALATELRGAGVPEPRVAAVIDALRLVYARAIAGGLVRASPLVGFAAAPAPGPASPSPSTAVLALAEHLVAWTTRAIVAAFVLAALGLILALT